MAYFIPEHAVCGLHFYMLIYTPYYFFIIPFLVRTPPPMSVIPLRSDKISALCCRPQPPLQYYTIYTKWKKKQFPSMHVLNNFADNTICALSPRAKSCRRMCARFVIKKQLVRLFLISSTKYCSPTDYARVNTAKNLSSRRHEIYKKVIGAENHNAPPPHRCCCWRGDNSFPLIKDHAPQTFALVWRWAHAAGTLRHLPPHRSWDSQSPPK